MKTRLELLQEMLAQDPRNLFARYGLAQEHAGSGRLEEAAAEFARLVELNPDYAPAYFHGGKALEKLGRTEEARQLYTRGLGACQRSGDEHALSEMRAALEELP